jgi:hypothetical protein
MKMSLVAPAVKTRNASFVETGRTDLIVVMVSRATVGFVSKVTVKVSRMREIAYSVACCSPPSLLCMEVVESRLSVPLGLTNS